MTRLSTVQAHIAAMNDLLGIVGAMRSLAGMRLQEAQKALPGIRRYARSVVDAIGAALLLAPEPEAGAIPTQSRRALVIYMAEHGFAGGFSERLVEAAKARLQPKDALFIVGSRGAVSAVEHGWKTTWTRPMATHLAATPEMARSLVAELYRRIARGEVSQVEVLFTRHPASIERVRLLPLDFASLKTTPPRQPPLCNLDPGALLEKLVEEYVSALLTEAAVESIASENAARFAAMESARENVSRKLDSLRQEARQARQTEITNELLELTTGAEALRKP